MNEAYVTPSVNVIKIDVLNATLVALDAGEWLTTTGGVISGSVEPVNDLTTGVLIELPLASLTPVTLIS